MRVLYSAVMSQGDTLYKSRTPDRAKSEFYEVVFSPRTVDGPQLNGVTETHGWWDNEAKKLIHEVRTLNPDEAMSFEDAQRMYFECRSNRARGGFVHSFTRNHMGEEEYQLIRME